MFHVYILYSPSLDRFYIGQTNDVARRIFFHRAGRETYTRRAEDWELVFSKAVGTRGEALLLEQRIKRSKSRKSIQRWIQGANQRVGA